MPIDGENYPVRDSRCDLRITREKDSQNEILRTIGMQCGNLFCLEIFFLNGVCETRLFMLVLRARSSCFTHGVREVHACVD